MKTPDEIKKGLGLCQREAPSEEMGCSLCPYDDGGYDMCECTGCLSKDALTYIQQLEKRLADVNASPFDGGMSQAEYFSGEAGTDG